MKILSKLYLWHERNHLKISSILSWTGLIGMLITIFCKANLLALFAALSMHGFATQYWQRRVRDLEDEITLLQEELTAKE